MPRFFTPPIDGDRALITGEDASHITRSLRLRPGEELTLCDGSGFDYRARILETGDPVVLEVLEKLPSVTEPRAAITLFQALPKGDKMEFIIQKSVELGVRRIVPLMTSRCVSRPDPKSMEKSSSATARSRPRPPSRAAAPSSPRCCPSSPWSRRQRCSPPAPWSFTRAAAGGWPSSSPPPIPNGRSLWGARAASRQRRLTF